MLMSRIVEIWFAEAVLGQNSAVSKLVDKDVDVSEASKKSISSVQLSDSIYGGRKVFDDFMLYVFVMFPAATSLIHTQF